MTGRELRALRKALQLTQAQFAEQLGVHWNSQARMERDEMPIREPVARLARLLVTAALRRRPPTPTKTRRRGRKPRRRRRTRP